MAVEEAKGAGPASRDTDALPVTVTHTMGSVPVGRGMRMDTSARTSRPAATSYCRALKLIREVCGNEDDIGSAAAAAASSRSQAVAETKFSMSGREARATRVAVAQS